MLLGREGPLALGHNYSERLWSYWGVPGDIDPLGYRKKISIERAVVAVAMRVQFGGFLQDCVLFASRRILPAWALVYFVALVFLQKTTLKVVRGNRTAWFLSKLNVSSIGILQSKMMQISEIELNCDLFSARAK